MICLGTGRRFVAISVGEKYQEQTKVRVYTQDVGSFPKWRDRHAGAPPRPRIAQPPRALALPRELTVSRFPQISAGQLGHGFSQACFGMSTQPLPPATLCSVLALPVRCLEPSFLLLRLWHQFHLCHPNLDVYAHTSVLQLPLRMRAALVAKSEACVRECVEG